MAGGIIPCPPPERAYAPSRATATAALAAMPPPSVPYSTLLIFSLPPAKQPIDAPDLIERGQAEADHARRASRSTRASASAEDLADRFARRTHRKTCPFGCIEQMDLARLRTQSDAITNLRPQRRIDPRDGGPPARSKWISVSEPSGSTSLMLTAMPSAASAATAKMFGANAEHGLAGLAQVSPQSRRSSGTGVPPCEDVALARAIRPGRNSSRASR